MNKISSNTRIIGNSSSADYELDTILNYGIILEELIQKEKSRNDVLQLSEDENDRSFYLNNTITRNLRYSIIISLVTFLEIQFLNFCKMLSKIYELKIMPTDIKGSSLYQFKFYTTKVIDIGFDYSTHLWQEVTELVELRNCIVHYDGQIEDWHGRKFSRSSIISNIEKKHEFLFLEESSHISLSKDSHTHYNKTLKSFIEEIYHRANDKTIKDAK